MDDNTHDRAALMAAFSGEIVAAHVSNNRVAVDELPGLITGVHAALAALGKAAPEPEAPPVPAVSVRSSVKPAHLVCLEDGKKVTMLKRHLRTAHGLSPDEYRERWGLAADYPMVASDFADARRDLAIRSGLGRKPNQNRGRRKKA